MRSVTAAFVKSDDCTPEFVAAVPIQWEVPGKIAYRVARLPLRVTRAVKAELRAWRKIARSVSSRKSLSELITAALYWHSQKTA